MGVVQMGVVHLGSCKLRGCKIWYVDNVGGCAKGGVKREVDKRGVVLRGCSDLHAHKETPSDGHLLVHGYKSHH